jgi:hypothetical protein
MLLAQIFWIDASDTRDHIGRYNFSTSSEHYKHAIHWIDTKLSKLIAVIPTTHLGDFEGCFERVTPRGPLSCQDYSVNSGQSSTRSYLSVLASFYGADDSNNNDPPQTFRKNRPFPQLTFDFHAELDFPILPVPAAAAPGIQPVPSSSPNQLTKSASSSITMSEINVVRSKMQSQFKSKLKLFKDKIVARLEHDIADAVKTSVESAMLSINAQMNELFQANNKIIYTEHAIQMGDYH